MTETIHHGRSSAEVIERIFAGLPRNMEVLDLTYGKGTFWKWNWGDKLGGDLDANDLFAEFPDEMPWGIQYRSDDFTAMPDADNHFDLVVFDPPFTAQGPNKKTDERHNDRYGSTRDLPGAPRNIHDVHQMLTLGIHEACRIAQSYVIVKTQSVVESGRLHSSVDLAMNEIVASGFNITQTIRFFAPRRAQPEGRRVTGLGGQPSVFIVAERNSP